MSQCGLLDKWQAALIILVKNNNTKDRLNGNSHRKKIKYGSYNRATPGKFFGVSLTYLRSLEGSKKAN